MTKKIGTLRVEKNRAIQGQKDMRKANLSMRNELAAVRALLVEALETFDDNPAEDHEIADRIRSYLDACAALGDKP